MTPATTVRGAWFRCYGRSVASWTHLGIEPEVTVMFSLLGADKVQLGVAAGDDCIEAHQALFDRATVVLPDVLAKASVRPEQALRPVFDLVWQAAGFDGSRNYNAAGEWAPQLRQDVGRRRALQRVWCSSRTVT